HRVAIQAYTPLERGSVVYNPVVRKIASRYGKTPVQIALNYVISHKNVMAIPKTERVEHVQEILGSMGWRLSTKDLEYIKKHA
ncbi:MAG: aldo/keto reductase, partial [Desulfurococcaceae archaeon]